MDDNPISVSEESPLPLSRRPRLAVFGGSFDPVHNGHLLVAGEVLASEWADEVLFVPARQPPHKGRGVLSDAFHRLEMLRLALEPFPDYSLSDVELAREESLSYTFDTMTILREVFQEHQLRFLMGMDSLVSLHHWYRATELVQRFEFIVYGRPGVHPPSFAELAGRFGQRNARKLLASVLELGTSPVSATDVRARCAAGRPVTGLLSPAVAEYIERHELYRGAELESGG